MDVSVLSALSGPSYGCSTLRLQAEHARWPNVPERNPKGTHSNHIATNCDRGVVCDAKANLRIGAYAKRNREAFFGRENLTDAAGTAAPTSAGAIAIPSLADRQVIENCAGGRQS
jgi:hypothetical protein